ncbi:alpha/beta hydrolase family protein [Rathayibacter tritici]|uniref:alpha/beta hydrolase family protein n=1 Tax=Rathayibacter tritici TaxID=33888 RepID=UPI0012FB5EC1|nr:prolyl oligopeptidase family serine peptidase [Rathayibacter tritici]
MISAEDERVLVRVDIPGTDRFTSSVVSVTRDNLVWSIGASVEADYATPLSVGDVLYARNRNGSSVLFVRSAKGVRREVVTLPGRVQGLITDGDERVWAIVREPFRGGKGSPFDLTSAIHFERDASIGSARRADGRLAVWLLRVGSWSHSRVDIGDEIMTGEASFAGGCLVLGSVRSNEDGTKNFGLTVHRADGGIGHVYLREYDLSLPCGNRASTLIGCLATRRPVKTSDIPWQGLAVVTTDLAGFELVTRGPEWDAPVAQPSSGKFLTIGDLRGARRLFVRGPAAHDFEIPAAHSILDAAIGGETLAAIVSSPNLPPTLQVGTVEAWARGDAIPSVDLGQTILTGGQFHFRIHAEGSGTGSVETGMWVCSPSGSPKGLIVLFHGGPMKTWSNWSWRWNPWPFVAAGYVVALCDPPMSLGYGDAAVQAGWRNWRDGVAGRAARDVAALRRELALGDRKLILMGGSFGGYLALATARELGASMVVAHAAPLDLARVADASDVSWQWAREFGSTQNSLPIYESSSVYAHEVPASIPILLSHGLNDDLVPVQESLTLHRHHRAAGGYAELVIFRDEAHPLLRPQNLSAWYEWVLASIENGGCAA